VVSEGNSFSLPKFAPALRNASQQSCRVPEHSVHAKAVLKRTRSSSWPPSKLQNTLEKAYFKAVIPRQTVLLECRKEVKEKEQQAFSLPSGESREPHHHPPLQTTASQERSYHIIQAALSNWSSNMVQ